MTPKNRNKKKVPTYNEYIKFLREQKSSVEMISFGKKVNNNDYTYTNIDGNNRINAIIAFIKSPLLVLNDEYPKDIKVLSKYLSLKL